MRKLLTIGFIFMLIFSQSLKAQQPHMTDELREARLDSLLNEVIFDDDELSFLFGVKRSFQFLYFRSSFDSRTFFAGREIGVQQHNLSGQLYYLHSKGFYAGVSGAWYSQLDPGYRTTILTGGYSNSLKKMDFFRYRFSYDYFLFNNDDPEFDPLYSSGLNAGITLKSKSLGTRFDAYFLLGDDVGTSLSWDAFAYLDLVRLGTYDQIRLEPEVSLYFGSELVEYQLNEVIIDPVTNIGYDYYFEDAFGLMNLQLQLPLNIKYKRFDFEAAWIYNLPQTIGDGISYDESSFFRLSLGCILSL